MTFFCIMHMAAVKRRQICSPTKKVPCIYIKDKRKNGVVHDFLMNHGSDMNILCVKLKLMTWSNT